MMSPYCSGGCSQREDADPIHYYYHAKSGEICPREGEPERATIHMQAAAWLQKYDLNGGDPLALLSAEYTIPVGATVLLIEKG